MAASLARTLFASLRLRSLKVRAESNQTPNHLVASVAKGASLPSTLTARSLFAGPWPLLLDNRMSSVFDVSNRTALLSAHLRLSAHHFRPDATTSMVPPSTNQVTSSTKDMP